MPNGTSSLVASGLTEGNNVETQPRSHSVFVGLPVATRQFEFPYQGDIDAQRPRPAGTQGRAHATGDSVITENQL